MQLSEHTVDEAFQMGLIEDPIPLDIGVYLISKGYIIDSTVTMEEDFE